MSSTLKRVHPLNGAHTAGIFADISVDGPEIGTLVIIVDRAKNLPNRKTIGKQNAYCAARLGKQVQKTFTEARGGQTPKWDQELRFTVHDSPDYYQLKLSVFSDDAKADFIGETWIDLKSIIVGGGGLADFWQALHCRGKYSGEIRIEITYYDARDKFTRAETSPRPTPHPSTSKLPEMNGRASVRGVVKRRPLPTDPTRFRDAAAAADAPAVPAHTPLRKQPSHQSQYSQYSMPPAGRPTPPLTIQRHAPADHSSPSPFSTSPPYHSPPAPHKISHARSTDAFATATATSRDSANKYSSYAAGKPRNLSSSDMYSTFVHEAHHELHLDLDIPPPPPAHRTRHTAPSAHDMVLRTNHEPPAKAIPQMLQDVLKHEAHRRSIGSNSSRPSYHPYDSIPADMALVYNVSGSHYQPPQHTQSLDSVYDDHVRSLQPTVEDAPESPVVWSQTSFPSNQRHSVQRSSLIYEVTPDIEKSATPAPLNLNSRGSVNPGKTSNSHNPASSASNFSPSPNQPPQAPPHESQRQITASPTTMNEYSHVPSPAYTPSPVYGVHGGGHGPAPPRRGSFVEHDNHDPCQTNNALIKVGNGSLADYDPYNHDTYPAPPAPARRGNFVEPSRHPYRAHSPALPTERRGSFNGQAHSPLPARRGSFVNGGYISNGRDPSPAPRLRHGSAIENYENALVHVPSVPPSLIPGIDPETAKEIAERLNGENRMARYNQQYSTVSAPGRPRTDTYPHHDRGRSPAPFASGSFESRTPGYEPHGPVPTPRSHSRGVSPSPMPSPMPSPTPSPMAPQRRIPRKSVSPAPSFSGTNIPFGPDSFDALNPGSKGTSPKPEAVSKIITHDGREIDPSDHLPMDTWAPEPEPKQKPLEPQGRPMPAGAQPMPPSGRRQLRIAHRQSTSASHVHHQPDGRTSPGLPPPTPGRGRLQKKSSRTMAPPSPGTGTPGAPGSAPLAPIHSNTYHDSHNQSSRTVPRTTTWDYPNANMPSVYGTSPGARGASFSHRSTLSGPPIPAKIPLCAGSGEDWALMQELSQIDLGAGRTRRQHY